jgi:hypothetical protein
VTIACARLFRIVLRGLEIAGLQQNDPKALESFAWSNIRAGLDVMSQGAIHLGPQQPVPPTRRRESLRFLGMSVALVIVSKYLEKNGKTIKSIVEGKVIEFENGQKRIIDMANNDFQLEPVYIDDLRSNPKKKVYQNRLVIPR